MANETFENLSADDIRLKNLSENLIALRKSRKLTQQTLSKEINYSDKSISRWENGDNLPDVSILLKICDFYGVDISYLFEKHETAPKFTKKPINEKTTFNMQISVILLIFAVSFALATFFYVYTLLSGGTGEWRFFILSIPVSLFLSLFFVIRWWNKIIVTVFASLLLWSTITYLFFQYFHSLVSWSLFLIGAPVQMIIILLVNISKGKKNSIE